MTTSPNRTTLLLSLPLLAITLLLACTPDDEPETAPAPTSTALSPAPPSPTPTTPSPSPTPDPPDFPEPAWSVTLDQARGRGASGIGETADGYLAVLRTRLQGLTANGEPTWQLNFEQEIWPQITAGGRVVVVSFPNTEDSRWPQPDVVQAIDTATGDVIWSDDRSSFNSVTRETVYLTTCNGEQNGEFGNCELAAHDPLTGDVRWAIATEASAQVKTPGARLLASAEPPFLILETFPNGTEDRTIRTIDPASGNWLPATFQGGYDTVPLAAKDTLLSVAKPDGDPDDGCEATTLTAISVNGNEERWQRSYELPVLRADEERSFDECARLSTMTGLDDAIVTTVTGQAPEVIDTVTGEPRWELRQGDSVVAARDDIVLVRRPAGSENEQDELIRYDAATGEPAWTVPAPEAWSGFEPQALLAGNRVIAYDPNYDTCASRAGSRRCSGVEAYDVASGELVSAPEGEYAGLGIGWVAAWTGGGGNQPKITFSLYPTADDT